MSRSFFAITPHNISPEDWQRALFLLYQEKVRKLSEKNYKENYLEKKELRGKGYSLDHKISIKECFEKKIPIIIAADIANLEMIPEEHNREKGSKSSIIFEELIDAINDREELI